MSFGSGGFGGFGQNNQSSGFGGFGQSNTNNNTSTGFGSGTTGGFGQNNNTAGGGLFGSNANTTTNTGGFGASTGGFGSGGFGNKPSGFGTNNASTTGTGGLFGSPANNNAGSSGFGGFGSTNNNAAATTSSPFGGASTGGGLFGSNNNASKPSGFGTTGNTGSSLFGGGAAAGTSNNTGFGGAFGASTGMGAGAVGDPPGTGGTPFSAFTEKEAGSTSTNSFQNIVFQDPYKKWSPEELRLTDYAQGRRHGNATGGGAFGVSSGFGGAFGQTNQANNAFGSNTNANTTGTGMFGNNNTTNTGTGSGMFGQSNNNAAGGFGSPANNNTSGGLFGQNKPATGGGLFGSSNTQQQSGGLFGANNNASGGFGNTANNNTTTTNAFGSSTGGGLFGSNNNQQKPASSGLFGGSTAVNSTAGSSMFGGGQQTNNAFGSTNNNTTAGGGLFGNTNNNQQQQSGGGLFGNNTQQNNQQPSSGGLFGGGGFGQNQNQNQQPQQQAGGGLFGNQQKPATGGLFGQSTNTNTTGGGLFGNNTQQQPNQGAFGNNANTNTGGGLFGGAKPATGGGLFGSTQNQNNTASGGLFGNANNQQNQQSGGLFGSTNNQQAKPGLFGSTNQNQGGMFGNSQNQGSSMFNNSQQQQNTMGSSLLGNSQQQNNAPQGLTANLNDVSAYGSSSLFSNLGGTESPNPGPLAVPLNSTPKPRRGSILPLHKYNPASASRRGGFGFSYSNYGTPGGSPASSISSTPGALGRSLLGASANGSLNKSMSVSNLRRNFNADDSILAPGAFSSSSSARWYGSTGSKKLVINRDIRSDLFSTPQKEKAALEANTSSRKLSKRVSFDTSNVDGDDDTPIRGALPAPEEVPASQSEETPRQSRTTNGANGARTPDTEPSSSQSRDLVISRETDNSATPEHSEPSSFDNTPGNYYMEPSKAELLKMNRKQRQCVDEFRIGRENVGSILFKVPVDLSTCDLDEICGEIVQLEPRSATVYPVAAKKPPVGKGLNVPAFISLSQSWPRGRDRKITNDPKRFNKHIERLKRIPDTTFEGYNAETGVWTFSVEHFTTYGLDDSDDSEDEDMEKPEQTVTTPRFTESQQMALDDSMMSSTQEDTFHFKQQIPGVPGGFDEMVPSIVGDFSEQPSFLGNSSADLAPNDVRLTLEDEYRDMGDEYDMSDDEDEARSPIEQHLAAEQDDSSAEEEEVEPRRGTPGAVLRARMRALKESAGPVTLEVAEGDDWMEMLRKTVSPAKRDRQLLRDILETAGQETGQLINFDKSEDEFGNSMMKTSVSRNLRTGEQMAAARLAMERGRGFATSIDLMNSLFEKPKPKPQSLRASTSSKGFPKWPYERQEKNLTADESERAFHDAVRPTWAPHETLLVTRDIRNSRALPSAQDPRRPMTAERTLLATGLQDIRLSRVVMESSKKFLAKQDALTTIDLVDGVPFARFSAKISDVYAEENFGDSTFQEEGNVWKLASILFDDSPSASKKEALSQFWAEILEKPTNKAVALASTMEEKALASLAGHRIMEACKNLTDGKDFHLATLVALIGTSETAKRDMREQLKAWHDSKMLSEFSEPIRALYELLSGNVCVCEGMKGVPVEDRMDSFIISTKFGLEWKQAFGLRLWYAISKDDDLDEAVKGYWDDISQDKEEPPRPWYLEQGISPLWDDKDLKSRQDIMWGLLHLYADRSVDLETVLRPENYQLWPMDMRLCWQLSAALTSTGRVSYGLNASEKQDALTLAFAAEVATAQEWSEALFVLLHLNDPSARKKAIQEHLCLHAAHIDMDSAEVKATILDRLQIPATWIWEALALFARSVLNEPIREVSCLFAAGAFVEAHRVLVQQVAPQAIVERNYDGLADILMHFQSRQESMPEWTLGGEVYLLFLELLQIRKHGDMVPSAILEKLLGGLHAMYENSPEGEITRFAAISDMADETAREILKKAQHKKDMDLRPRILDLPLTQDRLLAYSVDLGLDRFREVLSH